MPHPWVLAEQTHAFIRSQKWEVAVLPFGATEPHNLHMPYATDNYQVEEIGKHACQKAYEAGAKVLLLNGNGGNELKRLTRELFHRTSVFLCVCDWFRMATDQYPQIFVKPGEHADEVETSLGLAFFPDLLKPELADD